MLPGMPKVATSSTSFTPAGGAPAEAPAQPQKPLASKPAATGNPPTASLAHSGIRPPSGPTGPAAIPGANDPSFLAYMREMGVEEGDLNTLTGFRVNALTRQLGRALPAYAEQRDSAVRDAGFAAEDRGMFRSGMRMSDQAEAGRAVDRERQDYEAGIRDQVGEMYLTTAMDVAKIRRGLVEAGLSASAADVIARAEAGL